MLGTSWSTLEEQQVLLIAEPSLQAPALTAFILKGFWILSNAFPGSTKKEVGSVLYSVIVIYAG